MTHPQLLRLGLCLALCGSAVAFYCGSHLWEGVAASVAGLLVILPELTDWKPREDDL